MKKITSSIILFSILISTYSCSKDDNSGTLKVINQRDCIHNIFVGTSSGSLVGTIIENETKSFTIELGELNSEGNFYYADPHDDCEGIAGEQFNIVIEDGETTTIVLD